MTDAAKARNGEDVLAGRRGESDVLHFLTRTLQAHIIDAEPHSVLAKLRNLKKALEQQETTLSEWPESASKTRMCIALAKAKRVVTQIAEEFAVKAAAQEKQAG